jgi:nucleotide-binding universal stress UspA family protein
VHVLIATDGSDISVEAATRGIAMLRPDRKVTLMTVLGELPGADASGFAGSVYSEEEQRELEASARAEVAAELDRTAEALGGVDADRIVEVGDPASAICEIAERIGADVIVIGSHGRGFVQRVVLGSVSEHVVRHAPCPVLVVRHVPD